MATNGTDILLYANTGTPAVPTYTLVGSQRDVTFEESTEAIDTSDKSSRAFSGLPGRYKATISLEALYVEDDTAYQALRDAMRDGELILVERLESDGRDETANAIVEKLSESAPDQGEATVSISLTISGTWTEVGT